MSILATQFDTITAAMATAGFTLYTPNQEPRDPDASFMRKYTIGLGSGGITLGSLQAGGEAIDLTWPVQMTVHWEPAGSESTINNTVVADILTIINILLKQSNKAAGVRLIEILNISKEAKQRPITVHFFISVRILEEEGSYN